MNSTSKITYGVKLPDLIPYRNGKKWGYCDKKRNIILDCLYNEARPFSEGLAAIHKDKNWRYMNEHGEDVIVFNTMLASAGMFVGDIAEITFAGGFDSLDIGSEIIGIEVEEEKAFINKKLCLKAYHSSFGQSREGFLGVIKGQDYGEGLITVVKRGIERLPLWGYRNDVGEKVIDYKYDKALPFSEGLAAVCLNGEWRFIDKNEQTVLDMEIFGELQVQGFADGLAGVKLDKWGFINKEGKNVVDFLYNEIKHYSEDLAAVNIEGKWGFIDKRGEIIIPIEYSWADSFSDGLAAVITEQGCGYINQYNHFVIPPKYLIGYPFKNGLAEVVISNNKRLNRYYIDNYGNEYFEQ